MEIYMYTDSQMGMSDYVSWKQYTPYPKFWIIKIYPPTQNAGVWDVTSLSNDRELTQAMISTWNRLQV